MITTPVQTSVQVRPTRLAALAWTALILGIVGIVGSPIIFWNNLTAVVAGVGLILGIIAMFGSKKLLAAIGIALCIAGIVFTVLAQEAVVKTLDDLGKNLGKNLGSSMVDAKAPAQMLALGDTYHGADIDIAVANPKTITTGKYAVPEQNAKAISYEFTVTNHSPKPWPASMLLLHATAGDKAAEQVFDSGSKIGGAPVQDVLPGKSLKFTVAFLDAAPGDISLQVGTIGSSDVYFVHKR